MTLLPGSHRRRDAPTLARDSGRTVVGSMFSNFCNLAVVLVLARGLGTEAVGLYSIVFAARAILVLVSGLGMRVALTNFMASSIARSDWAMARGSARVGTLLPVAVSLVLTLIVFVSSGHVAAEAFGKPELAPLVRVAIISLPFAVAMDVSLSGTQGFQTMRPHARIALTLEPGLRLGLTCLALAAGFGIEGAVVSLMVASSVAGTAAITTFFAMVRRLPPARALVPWVPLRNFAAVSWVASLATQGLLWADVLILGALASSEEVGVYQVATRVVLTAMIVITPLTTSMAPRIARAWAQGDMPRLQAAYQGIVLWSWRLTIPVLVGALVVPVATMHAFGSGFSDGVDVIYILAAGAVVESLAAPSAVLLNQIGLNKLNMVINVCSVAGNIALNFALIPVLGIAGSALAWTCSLIIPGLVRISLVRRHLHTPWPVTPQHLAALVAAGVAGITAWTLVFVAPGVSSWPAQFAVASVTILVIYTGGVVWLGLNPIERARLRTLESVVVRATSTQFPMVRRWVNVWRLRRLNRGTEPLEIRRLISPYRYDVLARAEFFRLAMAHPELVKTRPSDFVELVSQSSYRRWFDAIVLPGLGLATAPRRQRELAFTQNIHRNLHLLRSFQRNGFDTRHPVTVVRIPAGTPVAGRRLAEDRWAPYDGCHRLSLLLLSGQTHLQSDQYVIHPQGAPRFNTERVARAEKKSREDLLQFYAWGLVDDPGARSITSWEDLIAQVDVVADRPLLAEWPEAQTLSRTGPPEWFEVENAVESHEVVSQSVTEPPGSGRGYR